MTEVSPERAEPVAALIASLVGHELVSSRYSTHKGLIYAL